MAMAVELDLLDRYHPGDRDHGRPRYPHPSLESRRPALRPTQSTRTPPLDDPYSTDSDQWPSWCSSPSSLPFFWGRSSRHCDSRLTVSPLARLLISGGRSDRPSVVGGGLLLGLGAGPADQRQ